MKIDLIRYDHNKESTSGLLFINDKFFCYVLEDERRDIKIKGETRIWEGIYDVGVRKDLTPLTKKYRNKFPWFEYHLEILNIRDFTGVYFHVGNFDENTMGCLLLADMIENQGEIEDRTYKSTQAFKRFYELVYPIAKAGVDIKINIAVL